MGLFSHGRLRLVFSVALGTVCLMKLWSHVSHTWSISSESIVSQLRRWIRWHAAGQSTWLYRQIRRPLHGWGCALLNLEFTYKWATMPLWSEFARGGTVSHLCSLISLETKTRSIVDTEPLWWQCVGPSTVCDRQNWEEKVHKSENKGWDASS